ncbi:uncharacterized protein LOC133699402 [Populus nigra]|uniref:uncharacterized protein LOC133699402 n=1 Tax=Populus nigra TaxID=3691 RepID=UPI002B268627|nr:uncharacterized protein LOC133699402 [Populus nigra]
MNSALIHKSHHVPAVQQRRLLQKEKKKRCASSQILNIDPLPSLSRVYAQVAQEERQQLIVETRLPSVDAVAFLTKSFSKFNNNRKSTRKKSLKPKTSNNMQHMEKTEGNNTVPITRSTNEQYAQLISMLNLDKSHASTANFVGTANFAAIIQHDEPKFYTQAITDVHWRAAMQQELEALEQNHSWTLEPLPPRKKPIGSKWVYKIKYHSDGIIERYKAHLVVKVAKSWELHQLNVHNAFLHGDLDEEVYMTPPPRYLSSADNSNTSLFTHSQGTSFTALLVYVDDVIIASNNSAHTKALKDYLDVWFHIKDLGPLKYFLGLGVARFPDGIVLSQCKYALDILHEVSLLGSKPFTFPMEQNHKLALDDNRGAYLAIRVLRYLKSAPGQGIFLPSKSDLQLHAYSCEIIWLRTLLHDLMVPISSSAHLYCDDHATIHIAANLIILIFYSGTPLGFPSVSAFDFYLLSSQELNVVLCSNGQEHVDEDGDDDDIHIEDCNGADDDSIDEEEEENSD